MKKTAVYLVLMMFVLSSIVFGAYAEENLFVMHMDNLIMPNSGLGLIEEGVLKAPMDANEYLMLFNAPGLENDHIHSGNVNLKFIGSQEWAGVRFVVGYQDPTHFTMVRIEKTGKINLLARDPDSGWISEIGEENMINSYPLYSNLEFTYRVERTGHDVALYIDDVKMYEASITPDFDYFTEGSSENVGIFNSKVTINVTDISIVNAGAASSSSEESSQEPTAAPTATEEPVSSEEEASAEESSEAEASEEEVSEIESSEEEVSEEVSEEESEEESSQAESTAQDEDNDSSLVTIIFVVIGICVAAIVVILLNKKFHFIKSNK